MSYLGLVQAESRTIWVIGHVQKSGCFAEWADRPQHRTQVTNIEFRRGARSGQRKSSGLMLLTSVAMRSYDRMLLSKD
jgi:hypothetical protein